MGLFKIRQFVSWHVSLVDIEDEEHEFKNENRKRVDLVSSGTVVSFNSLSLVKWLRGARYHFRFMGYFHP